MGRFRYIEKYGHNDVVLTQHEINELAEDYDIDVADFYALVAVTEDEFQVLVRGGN